MTRPRREPGEGSISWNSYHERYVGALIIGKDDATGRPKMKTCQASAKGKTRAAYAEVEQLLKDMRAGLARDAEAAGQAEQEAADRSGYTLWDCILDWHAWVPTTGKTSQQTADKLRDTCRRWLHPGVADRDPAGHVQRTPALREYLRGVGDTPLIEVDAALLVECMQRIAPLTGRPILSDVLSTIRRAIRRSMQQRNPVVSRNVASDVDLPRAGRSPHDPTFLTKEQVQAVFTVTKGTRMHALVMTGFLLGLRPGEIRALKWEHVDFVKGFLYVQKWARKGGDGKTKTDSSYRGLPVPNRLLEALRAHEVVSCQLQQNAESTARLTGEFWEHVFTAEDGRQFDKDALAWRVGQVFKAAGLPPYDPYTMRHTFCSLMVDQGVSRRKIADAMGHADLITFERIYRHKLRPEVTNGDDLWGGAWDAA